MDYSHWRVSSLTYSLYLCTSAFCNIFGPAAAPNCDELPEFLTHVVVRMPVGFLCSPGSMNLRLGNVDTKFRVKNQYCTVSLWSSEVHIKGAVLYPL